MVDAELARTRAAVALAGVSDRGQRAALRQGGGGVIGVVVGVVAVAAWLGGRWAAVLPLKSDRRGAEGAVLPLKSDRAAITCPETDPKVIQGGVGGRNSRGKVIAGETAPGEVDRDGKARRQPSEPAPRVLAGARPGQLEGYYGTSIHGAVVRSTKGKHQATRGPFAESLGSGKSKLYERTTRVSCASLAANDGRSSRSRVRPSGP